MSARYRIIVWKDFRFWCRVDSHGPIAKEAIDEMVTLLNAQHGYSVELQVSHDDKRILETGPNGTRLLAVEPIYNTVEINSVDQK
jgi:hypothetical protein